MLLINVSKYTKTCQIGCFPFSSDCTEIQTNVVPATALHKTQGCQVLLEKEISISILHDADFLFQEDLTAVHSAKTTTNFFADHGTIYTGQHFCSKNIFSDWFYVIF